MAWTSMLAIYFVIWWVVLFAVLPWGVRTQEEAGDVLPGSPESAPAAPRMGRVVLITTLVSGAVFALVYLALTRGWLDLYDLPFGPKRLW